MKKEVLRQCIATRIMFPKGSLIRIVAYQGEVKVDKTHAAPGRGAYLSKSSEALALAKKKNLLERALKAKVPVSIYEELESLING